MDNDNNTNDAAADSLYLRQSTLGINQAQRVAIIGCGGIGSWISLFIGLAGVRYIEIYDADEISIHNLNRFPLGPDAIGKVKSVAMAEHISRLRPGVVVTPRGHFNPELHSLHNCDWMVVSTDSLKSRRMIYAQARLDSGYGTKYIECGADGHRMTVTFEPAAFATDEEDQPGYRSVPVFVGPCVMAASIAAYYILLGEPQQLTYGAEWDGSSLTVSRVSESDDDVIPDDISVEEVAKHVHNLEAQDEQL